MKKFFYLFLLTIGLISPLSTSLLNAYWREFSALSEGDVRKRLQSILYGSNRELGLQELGFFTRELNALKVALQDPAHKDEVERALKAKGKDLSSLLNKIEMCLRVAQEVSSEKQLREQKEKEKNLIKYLINNI